MDRLRVLLVGNLARLEQISLSLRQSGHAIVPVGDLGEAADALLVQKFDAVLLDPDLPASEIAGFTAALRKLQGDRSAGGTAVLSVSGAAQAELGSAVDATISDSVDPDVLTLTIARLASAVSSHTNPGPGPSAPELPVLEVEELKEQVAFDDELLVELIDLFLSERLKQTAELREALASEAYEQLSRVAHTIKGSLGSLHATAARMDAQALEMAARDSDAEKCRDFLPMLERNLDRLDERLLQLRRSIVVS